MIEEDDAPKLPHARFVPSNLESLGAAELTAYRTALVEEIARVDREIERKSSYRTTAAAFFRKP